MKRTLFLLLLACISLTMSSLHADDKPALRYVDALQFRMINKGWAQDVTFTPYTRIPGYLKDSISPDLWDRCKNSAGIAIRFATDSKRIGIRYNLHSNFHMVHMADTGIKGTDLYILGEDGKWKYVNTNRPTKDSIQNKIYVENMDGTMHECMIYLPLYDGINWMEIGVDSTATLQMPQVDNPRRNIRIVNYGTSIMHGGCASRTGMAATNIMQRELNVEMINLGTSGEGKMVYKMAEEMSKIENVAAYIIDPVPNCTQMMCDTLTYGFINILRKAHPEIPIIMVEGPMYPYAKFDSFFGGYLPKKNEEYRKNYERLKKENPANLYYVDCEGLTGADEEGTVDGIHLTDLGFRAYADKLEQVLIEVLGDKIVEKDNPYFGKKAKQKKSKK